MSKAMRFYECGICDCYHPWDWNGDCREDTARFVDVPYDAEILTMAERFDADEIE